MAALAGLGIRKDVGQELTADEVAAVLDFYVAMLDATVRSDSDAMATPAARLHVQVPFAMPPGLHVDAVTVSGGVGELIYAHLDGAPWPPTTHFGDLGIDLARRLLESPWWGERLRRRRPHHHLRHERAVDRAAASTRAALRDRHRQ